MDSDDLEDDLEDDLSESSLSSCGIVRGMFKKAGDDARSIHAHIEDPTIEWDKDIGLHTLSESDCVQEFRFRKVHLRQLIDGLQDKGIFRYLPEGSDALVVKCKNKYHVSFEVGMLVLLYRLARPRRLRPEMERFFGIRKSRLSSIISTFTSALYAFAEPYFDNPAIFHDRMPYYAQLVALKCGNLVDIVWGLIDGTVLKTARPSYFQKLLYSGHKRAHGIKFQLVVTPDGLIALLFGPINGNRHDSFMLSKSQLIQKLRELMPEDGSNGIVWALYGDPAYPQSIYLFGGFRNPADDSPEAAWNTAMSKVREPVEWNFKEITCQFSYLNYKRDMKIFQSPITKYYVIGAFLTNIRSLFYGNQTAHYFGARRFTMEQYLNLVNHN